MHARWVVIMVALSGCLGGGTPDDESINGTSPASVPAGNFTANAPDNTTSNGTSDDAPLALWDLPLPTATIEVTRVLVADGNDHLAMWVDVASDFQFSSGGSSYFLFLPDGAWEGDHCMDHEGIVGGYPGDPSSATQFPAGRYLLVHYGGDGYAQYQVTIGLENEIVDSEWLIVNDFTTLDTWTEEFRTEGLDAQASISVDATPLSGFIAVAYDDGEQDSLESEYYTKAGASEVQLTTEPDCGSADRTSQPTPLPTLPLGFAKHWGGGNITAHLEYSRDYDQGDHILTVVGYGFTPN